MFVYYFIEQYNILLMWLYNIDYSMIIFKIFIAILVRCKRKIIILSTSIIYTYYKTNYLKFDLTSDRYFIQLLLIILTFSTRTLSRLDDKFREEGASSTHANPIFMTLRRVMAS